MNPAVLHIPTRLVFGEDSIDRLGSIALELGAQRALLVTDSGIVAAGHVGRAVTALERAGIDVGVFDQVHENPTTADVQACLEAARTASIDLIIGLGGGSSIDTARGCNFLLTNGGRMEDYWGVGKATKPMLPMIAIPTTTGTGSEMQSFALIATVETHQKMACGDSKAQAKVAILDPTLSATQPRHVMACTGLDCISHALETAVSRRRTPFSQMFSREAWRLASANFSRILHEPSDLEAQGHMLLAAAYAGIAIEHSMLGAAHALANPLTSQYDVTHGRAVGMMLPHVLRFNAADDGAQGEYAQLARLRDAGLNGAPAAEACASLIAAVENALNDAHAARALSAYGVDSSVIESLAETASRQWTAQFNPREVSRSDLHGLYLAALNA